MDYSQNSAASNSTIPSVSNSNVVPGSMPPMSSYSGSPGRMPGPQSQSYPTCDYSHYRSPYPSYSQGYPPHMAEYSMSPHSSYASGPPPGGNYSQYGQQSLTLNQLLQQSSSPNPSGTPPRHSSQPKPHLIDTQNKRPTDQIDSGPGTNTPVTSRSSTPAGNPTSDSAVPSSTPQHSYPPQHPVYNAPFNPEHASRPYYPHQMPPHRMPPYGMPPIERPGVPPGVDQTRMRSPGPGYPGFSYPVSPYPHSDYARILQQQSQAPYMVGKPSAVPPNIAVSSSRSSSPVTTNTQYSLGGSRPPSNTGSQASDQQALPHRVPSRGSLVSPNPLDQNNSKNSPGQAPPSAPSTPSAEQPTGSSTPSAQRKNSKSTKTMSSIGGSPPRSNVASPTIQTGPGSTHTTPPPQTSALAPEENIEQLSHSSGARMPPPGTAMHMHPGMRPGVPHHPSMVPGGYIMHPHGPPSGYYPPHYPPYGAGGIPPHYPGSHPMSHYPPHPNYGNFMPGVPSQESTYSPGPKPPQTSGAAPTASYSPSYNPANSSKNQQASTNCFLKLLEMGPEPHRRAWLEHYFRYMDDISKPVTSIPQVVKQDTDMYKLYLTVKDFGGLMEVMKAKKWKEVATAVHLNITPSAGYTLRKNYIKYLFDYECKFDRDGIDPAPLLAQIEAMGSTKRRKQSPAGQNEDKKVLPPPSPVGSHSSASSSQQHAPGNFPHSQMDSSIMNQSGTNDSFNRSGAASPARPTSSTMSQPSSITPLVSSAPPSNGPWRPPHMYHSAQGPPPNMVNGSLPPHHFPNNAYPQVPWPVKQPSQMPGMRPGMMNGMPPASSVVHHQPQTGTRPPVQPQTPCGPQSNPVLNNLMNSEIPPKFGSNQVHTAPPNTEIGPSFSDNKPGLMHQFHQQHVIAQQEMMSRNLPHLLVTHNRPHAPSAPIFPPGCVEATPIEFLRRRRIRPRELLNLGLQPTRILMGLRSGLGTELAWALNALNVVLRDDQASREYVPQLHLPTLVNNLVSIWRRCLGILFDRSTYIDQLELPPDLSEDLIDPVEKGPALFNSRNCTIVDQNLTPIQALEREIVTVLDIYGIKVTHFRENLAKMLSTIKPNISNGSKSIKCETLSELLLFLLQNESNNQRCVAMKRKWTCRKANEMAPILAYQNSSNAIVNLRLLAINVIEDIIQDSGFTRVPSMPKSEGVGLESVERRMQLQNESAYLGRLMNRGGSDTTFHLTIPYVGPPLDDNELYCSDVDADYENCTPLLCYSDDTDSDDSGLVHTKKKRYSQVKSKRSSVTHSTPHKKEDDDEMKPPTLSQYAHDSTNECPVLSPQPRQTCAVRNSEENLDSHPPPIECGQKSPHLLKAEEFEESYVTRHGIIRAREEVIRFGEHTLIPTDGRSNFREHVAQCCMAAVTALRNLSFMEQTEHYLSRHKGFLCLLGHCLLLGHRHLDHEDDWTSISKWSHASFPATEPHWLDDIRENAFSALINVSGYLELINFDEYLIRLILEGVLHWVTCKSMVASDPLPGHKIISSSRLALEVLNRLVVHERNVDLLVNLLPTDEYSTLKNMFEKLTCWVAMPEDQVTRELALSTLHYLVDGCSMQINFSSGMVKQNLATMLLSQVQPCIISALLTFIEMVEVNTNRIIEQHTVKALQERPDLMGCSLELVRRAGSLLDRLANNSYASVLFTHDHQLRLFNLSVSRVLDATVAHYLCSTLGRLPKPTAVESNAMKNQIIIPKTFPTPDIVASLISEAERRIQEAKLAVAAKVAEEKRACKLAEFPKVSTDFTEKETVCLSMTGFCSNISSPSADANSSIPVLTDETKVVRTIVAELNQTSTLVNGHEPSNEKALNGISSTSTTTYDSEASQDSTILSEDTTTSTIPKVNLAQNTPSSAASNGTTQNNKTPVVLTSPVS